MKKLTQRQKTVGCVFSIVATAWTLDMLTGGPQPQAADAASSQQLLTMSVTEPAPPAQIEALIEAINRRQIVREPLQFSALERDFFTPPESLRPAVSIESNLPEGIQADAPPQKLRAPVIPFGTTHTLRGVITGKTPLALIDDRLTPLGAVIDGYRLIKIEADAVTFEKDGRQEILNVVRSEPGNK